MVTVRRKRGFCRSQVVVTPTFRYADQYALTTAAAPPAEREEHRGGAGGRQRNETCRHAARGRRSRSARKPRTRLRGRQQGAATAPTSTQRRSPTCSHGGHRRCDEGDDVQVALVYHQSRTERWRGLDQAREGGIQGAHPGAAACRSRAPPPVLTRRRRAAAARSTSKSTRRRATSGLRSRRRTRPARGGRARCGPSTTRSSTSSTWSSTFP